MDAGYRLLAAKYIRRQVKQLAAQFGGVRTAEDIEFVHQARVATRRLRAALRLFESCFARKQVRRWQKAIRKTTAKLGGARDRDVQIELLCHTLSGLGAKECFPGISHVLVQLEHERESLQPQVVKAVERLDARGVLREMRRVTKRILRKAGAAAEQVQTPTAFAHTRRHVLVQLDELLRHQGSLADPGDQARHHAMRIAAKRLRYCLEIARPVYPGRLEPFVEATKRVQSLLGDIHDCDVWIEHLDVFAAQQRDRLTALFGHAGRLVHLQPGIEFLRQDRQQHRDEVFMQLGECWSELSRRRFWEGLTSVVLNPGQTGASTLPPLATPTTSRTSTALPVQTSTPPASLPAGDLEPALAAQTDRLASGRLERARYAVSKPVLTAGS